MKSFSNYPVLHRAKKLNPDAAVVAAGCYVQTKENEAKCDEAIDILIGNNQKKELVERLDAFFAGRGEKVEAVVDINHEKQAFEELTLDHAAEHTRAFIKVQDGCNQFCSYCIIPYARGRVRSRNVQNVLEEVKRLAASGYQEVVLTGIHLSSYGIDCGESLLHLIQMVHQVEGIRRIRLGSLEPRIVTETFAEELAKMEKICPHFYKYTCNICSYRMVTVHSVLSNTLRDANRINSRSMSQVLAAYVIYCCCMMQCRDYQIPG